MVELQLKLVFNVCSVNIKISDNFDNFDNYA